jgi:hypothetical protein
MAATTPQEIALSVLAAVVAERRGAVTARAADVAPDMATRAGVPAALTSATAMAGASATDAAASEAAVAATEASCCSAGAALAPLPLPELPVPASCCGGGAGATLQQPGDLAHALSAADEMAAARAALALPVVKSSCCGG